MTPVGVLPYKMKLTPRSSSVFARRLPSVRLLWQGRNSGRSEAFSLIEVALALGVVSFAILGVLGLLPISLDIHRNAVQRQFAIEALQQASVAVQSQFYNEGSGDYSFNDWLSQAGNPISWKAGDGVKEYSLDILSDGTVRNSSTPASTPTYQKLHLQVDAPSALDATSLPKGPVMVKLSVAWPATAQWSGQTWQNSTGSLDAVLYALPY
jgi:uncharacterized protein (TIGR02598 family)